MKHVAEAMFDTTTVNTTKAHAKWLMTAFLGGLVAVTHAAPLSSAAMDEAEVQRRATALIKQMTLTEKVGQITQLGAEEKNADELIRNGSAGAVLWTMDSALIARLQKIAVQESRLKIPMLFGFDVIHGYKTVFPVPLGMAASWNPTLVERAQAIAAHEASAAGINWTFGPMVDIARDARWGRIVEGAGEDPYLGSAMARAQVLGFQGPKLGTPNRLLGSVKHFAGYGAADGGRDYDSSFIPEGTFRNVYLPPFQAAIDAGVGNVMSAYMALNDVPASGNTWLMRDVLRRDLGFKGFVVSDSWAVNALTNHGLASDKENAALLGMQAGVNMDMASLTYHQHVANLVKSGKLPMGTVDQAVREILEVKLRMGIFENPYADLSKKDEVWNTPAHRQAARTSAQQSIVLLRNENRALPLSKGLNTVAVIGPLGGSTEEIKGSWTVEGGAAVSVLEGLRAKLPNASIEYVRGGDMQRAYVLPWEVEQGKKPVALMPVEAMAKEVQRAVEVARKSEVVVMVLGERAGMSGEAASTSSIQLQGNQQALLEAVVATGKSVVLVLLNGRPLDITWASKNVTAIVEAWFPGTEGGNAIADVLFGDYNPGGKLPMTWPRSTGHLPVYYNHLATHSRDDDPTFTSRYATNETSAPLYPFGYGLSYTTFKYSSLALSSAKVKAGESLKVSAEVENTGAVEGDEVVQLYIHQTSGLQARPVRELKGFQRVTLAPGAKKTVTFTLGRDELKYWNTAARKWVVDPVAFDLWVGGDSQATLKSKFNVIQ
jgi:beta-glucosidase